MEDYKQFLEYFNGEDYYHGGEKSSYTNYTWNGVYPAIKTFADDALSFFPKVKSILEVGGAKGYFTKELIDRGYKVTGFDASKWAVEEGVKEFPKELRSSFYVGDVTDPNTASNLSHDLVIAAEVLEHIPESLIDQTLQNLYNWSKRYVLFTVPFVNDESNDKTHITIHPREWWNAKLEPYFDYLDVKDYGMEDAYFKTCWNFFPLIKKSKIIVKITSEEKVESNG